MTDALLWLLALMTDDIGRLVGGILILAALIEFIMHFKEWVSS
jgi:hypothetical protein